MRTVISTLRSCPEIDDHRAAYTEIGEHPRPVLVLWGTADHTVPARPDELMAMLPRGRLHVLPGEAHSFLVTAPAAINREVVGFLAC